MQWFRRPPESLGTGDFERKTAMPEERNLTESLGKHPICAALTAEQIGILGSYLEPIHVQQDQVIAEIGEVGESLFFVIDGEVALYHEEGGREVEIGRMKTGELAGEMSFFDHVPQEIRLRALRVDTHLLRLRRTGYERLRAEHPAITVHLLEYTIISMDHLVRRVSDDVAAITQYLHSRGR
jgi:CRP/FNR family transcriptional regulator, cyclic AMP receptor protein